MIRGVSHLNFAVSDLERSLRFYADWLGFEPLVRWETGAYLQAGDVWVSLTLDKAAPEATNNSSYSHTAFAVAPELFEALYRKLLGLEVEEWQPNASPGDSFYFLDPDGHKLEIHAWTLGERLEWLRAHPRPNQVWLGRGA